MKSSFAIKWLIQWRMNQPVSGRIPGWLGTLSVDRWPPGAQ